MAVVVEASLIIVVTVVTLVKFHFYACFTNDDDFQDLSLMKYDAFVSYG